MSSWRSEMLSVSTDEKETSRASTSTFVQKPPITVGKRKYYYKIKHLLVKREQILL
jgi:hypothetical protein